jgi:serine/threonine protein kinase
LGEGAFSTVYLVRHASLPTAFALKVLTTGHRGIQERLRTEARAQAALRHPHVVAVHELLDVNGGPALLMEHVAGASIEQLLQVGPLSLDEVDALTIGLLRGVRAAHAAGMVHRDLKPANVLLALTEDGVCPKIADFGIVKVADAGGPHATRADQMLGTPRYMAPEQFDAAHLAGPTADVWGLGAMLYELVTDQPAFAGDSPFAIRMAIEAGPPADPRTLRPEIPARMAAAILGCLHRAPTDRWPTIDALLAAWTDGAPPPPPAAPGSGTASAGLPATTNP